MGIGLDSFPNPFTRGFSGWIEPDASPEFDVSDFCHLEAHLASAFYIRLSMECLAPQCFCSKLSTGEDCDLEGFYHDCYDPTLAVLKTIENQRIFELGIVLDMKTVLLCLICLEGSSCKTVPR